MYRPLLPLAFAAALVLPVATHAQERQPPLVPKIIVTGEGEQALRPDMALLSLSVRREAPTARAALDANNDAMAAVIAAMKSAGIEDRDLQTAGIQINPRYNYRNNPDGTQEAELVAYQVTNTLSVRVRDLAQVGEVIDRSVTLGVNQGGSIIFTNDDPDAALAEARKAAVADAREKAETLAQAAGTGLGRVIEISEQSFVAPPMPYQTKGMAMEMAARDSVPVEAGENTYRVAVTVTFELR